MEGDLNLLSIPDLLQMICLGGYSRDIHLFDGPTQLGVIAIRHGRVDRCFGFGTQGEMAFYKLVNLRCGHYKVNDAQDMSGSDAALAAHSWQELLMEAACRQDEAEHVAQSEAPIDGMMAFPTSSGDAAARELPARPLSVLTMDVTELDEETGSIIARLEDRPNAATSQPDITHLLEEATACYLRRDRARAEELLQQCLVLRPGDKRVLQNLERVRRKKST